MPIQVNTGGGPALIRVAGSGGLQDLGYTRNGADLTKEMFALDVPGDQNGGDEGPPIEVQYLGETARIRLELTKWDPAVAAVVEARAATFASGVPGTPGALYFASALTMRVVISTPTLPVNFPRCIPRQPIEINRGTKYSTLIVEFEAHKDGSGILYNNSGS